MGDLSDIAVKNICQFYPQDGGKNTWHRNGTKLHHCHPMYKKVTESDFKSTIMLIFLTNRLCTKLNIKIILTVAC